MGNTVHQYALFGNTQFKFDKTIAHASDPHRQIVICNNGSDARYATLEEWEEAGVLFDERAQIEDIVTSASPARDKLELFRSSLLAAKMFTLMDIAEKTEVSAIRPLAQTSGSREFAPKQPIKESNAQNAAIASSPN